MHIRYMVSLSIAIVYAIGAPFILSAQTKFIALLQSSSQRDYKDSEKNLKSQGFIIHHRYPPHVLKGVSPDSISYNNNDSNIRVLTETEVEQNIIDQIPENFRTPVKTWNLSFHRSLSVSTQARKYIPPIIGDCRIAPQSSRIRPSSRNPQSAPYGAGSDDTSEYMIGSISISVILPESTGVGNENWTAAKEARVQEEIEAGCQFWIDQDSRAHLSFTHTYIYGRTDTRAQVSVEPITLSMYGEETWIGEIMENMNHSEYFYMDQVRGYDHALRESDETNWAITVFIADSENDADGQFTDAVAYSYLGGPFIVMTYDNAKGVYDIENMDYVLSHELSHSFWALDEYVESRGAYNDENTYSGYLNIINGNMEQYGAIDVPCILRNITAYGLASPACTYTLQQIGWRDSDSDNIFDIIDTLGITLDDTSAFTNGTLKITGNATVLPAYSNTNSTKELYYGPASLNDISILTITDVQYNIDEGEWINAASKDYEFDSAVESFETAIAIPPEGYETIGIRAVDSLSGDTTATATFDLLNIRQNQLWEHDTTLSLHSTNLGITVQPFSFTENIYMIINSSATLPAPDSNAAQLNPTGIGAEISISTTEKATKPVSLIFSYNNTIISGMDESHLTVAYYDEDWNSWVPISSSIDSQANTVTAETRHFSYFQVFEYAPALTIGSVKPYPNPCNAKKGHTQIVFSNLTTQATIKIYTLLGEPVRTIEETDGNGLASWDTLNTGGKKVGTGTYIYRITDKSAGSSSVTGRIIVIR